MTVTSSPSLEAPAQEAAEKETKKYNMDEIHLFFKANHETQLTSFENSKTIQNIKFSSKISELLYILL